MTDIDRAVEVLSQNATRGQRFRVNTCSICGYVCGYFLEGGQWFYDAGCYCLGRPPEPREESQLRQLLKMNPRMVEGILATQ